MNPSQQHCSHSKCGFSKSIIRWNTIKPYFFKLLCIGGRKTSICFLGSLGPKIKRVNRQNSFFVHKDGRFRGASINGQQLYLLLGVAYGLKPSVEIAK